MTKVERAAVEARNAFRQYINAQCIFSCNHWDNLCEAIGKLDEELVRRKINDTAEQTECVEDTYK